MGFFPYSTQNINLKSYQCKRANHKIYGSTMIPVIWYMVIGYHHHYNEKHQCAVSPQCTSLIHGWSVYNLESSTAGKIISLTTRKCLIIHTKDEYHYVYIGKSQAAEMAVLQHPQLLQLLHRNVIFLHTNVS